jgi:hypothetical protein
VAEVTLVMSIILENGRNNLQEILPISHTPVQSKKKIDSEKQNFIQQTSEIVTIHVWPLTLVIQTQKLVNTEQP